jgi:formylglycine-generating enzyme required for sulfatase activity
MESSTIVGQGGALELRQLADGSWELHMTPATVPYTAGAGVPIEYRGRTTQIRQDWLQLPVSGITPEDAEAYAAWLDRTGRVPRARLCTEHEWERASRGADGRPYPHGDQLPPDDANIDATYGHREDAFGPDAVGAHPASTSPFGLVDASGNVWEISRSIAGTGFVTRGGCFYTSARTANLANRQVITATYRHLLIGFRVCAGAP